MFQDMTEISKAVYANGMTSVSTGSLRDAVGMGRLGVHVRHQIADELKQLGIRHHPQTIPNDQNAFVVLYSPYVAPLLEAVLYPGAETAELLPEIACGLELAVGKSLTNHFPAVSPIHFNSDSVEPRRKAA